MENVKYSDIGAEINAKYAVFVLYKITKMD